MAAVTFAQASRALQEGTVRPVYYLTGDEDVLKDEFVSALVEATVDPSTRDFNLDVRSAGDLDGEALNALIETPPMLAERRVVVVRGLEQWRKNAKVWEVLRRYLEHPASTTVCVLVHGAGERPDAGIAKAAYHVVLDTLAPSALPGWLARRAEHVGVKLEPEAAEHLIASVGSDLGLLSVELEKLAAASEGPVTASDVAALVGVRRGETVHDWIDAAIGRDIPRAIALLDGVLAQPGVSGVRLVMGLGTALVGMRHARAVLDGGAPPARARAAVFAAIRKARPPQLRDWKAEAAAWSAAAERWTASEMDGAIAAAYDADRALKSTTVSDEGGILRSMLLQFAPARAAA